MIPAAFSKDPAWYPWCETTTVKSYRLKVNKMSRQMMVREGKALYTGSQPGGK